MDLHINVTFDHEPTNVEFQHAVRERAARVLRDNVTFDVPHIDDVDREMSNDEFEYFVIVEI